MCKLSFWKQWQKIIKFVSPCQPSENDDAVMCLLLSNFGFEAGATVSSVSSSMPRIVCHSLLSNHVCKAWFLCQIVFPKTYHEIKIFLGCQTCHVLISTTVISPICYLLSGMPAPKRTTKNRNPSPHVHFLTSVILLSFPFVLEVRVWF